LSTSYDYRDTYRLVDAQVDAVQLTEANEVGTDKNPEFLALHLTLLALARVALVLKTNPQLVHLDKVGEDELDRVCNVSFGPIIAIKEVSACQRTTVTSKLNKRPFRGKNNDPSKTQNDAYPSSVPKGRPLRVCPLR
jgi:hypothetical protein